MAAAGDSATTGSLSAREEQISDIKTLMNLAENLIRQAAKFFNPVRLVDVYPFEKYLETRFVESRPWLRCDVGADAIRIAELVSAEAATDPELADEERTHTFVAYDAYELLVMAGDYHGIITEAGLEGGKRCFYVEALIERLTSEDAAFPASVFGPYRGDHAAELLALFQAMNALQWKLCYLMTSFQKAERFQAEGHTETADFVFTTLTIPMTETYEAALRLIAVLGSILDRGDSLLEAAAGEGADFSSQCDSRIRFMCAETSRLAVGYIVSAAHAGLLESQRLFDASIKEVRKADVDDSAEEAAAFAAAGLKIAVTPAGVAASRHHVGRASGALKRGVGFRGAVPGSPVRSRRGSVFSLVFGADAAEAPTPADPAVKHFVGLLLMKALNALESEGLGAAAKTQLKRDVAYLSGIYDEGCPEPKLRAMLCGLLVSEAVVAQTEPVIAAALGALQLRDESGTLILPFLPEKAERTLHEELQTYLDDNGFAADDPMAHEGMQAQLKEFLAAEAEAGVAGLG